MKKKPIWMCCLIVFLVCSVMVIRRVDAMEFNGLRIMSKEKLDKLTESLGRVDRPQNANDLILLDGHTVPYDAADNRFYVSQPLAGKEYAGTFRAAGDNCAIYLQQDDALKDKQGAIAEGHRFTIWFVTQDAYATSELVFTGLPMVCIRSEEGMLTEDYGRGRIVVHNPDDTEVITMSVKESAIETKVNLNSGTISFNLCQEEYDRERELSLLGLGKKTSWKLYSVYDKDDSLAREMVADYVWNSVCEDDTLKKGIEYAEVIVDGEYRGLYYLAPKIGKGYLGLGEEDRAYMCEEIPEDGRKQYTVVGDEDMSENYTALEQYENLWQKGNKDFEQVDVDNSINYNLYLQTACAVQNSREEYYIAAYGNQDKYQFCKVPGRSKFVFGLYPSRIGWQSVFAVENIMEDAEYAYMADRMDDILFRTVERWDRLREDALSTDRILEAAYLCEQRLADSGYIIREKEPGAYSTYCDRLHELIRERMNYLDSYYASFYS